MTGMSQEQLEDPSSWTAEDLLRVLMDDDGTDISDVSDEALQGAIPIAQTNGWGIQLGALEHENGRRAVLRGHAAPAHPEPLPPVLKNDPARARAGDEDAVARLAESSGHDGGRAGQLIYADKVMLPAEITLQQAVEIETFLKEHGTALLNAAEGTISYWIECTDLWQACEVAHEIVAEMQSHGIDAAVDRDLLQERGA